MRFTRKKLIKRLKFRIESFERDLEFAKQFDTSYYQIQAQKAKAKINEFRWLLWEIENWEELDL